ncbi:TonB-dependent receptor domain-containing protein [Roseateles sp. DC23W]|uniref:TonB-dependent receptor domain-containing protein n=1 Tax=Pelomonas dachongensis TaxID=3299029 RepID=A0ABW7EU50_9BURK
MTQFQVRRGARPFALSTVASAVCLLGLVAQTQAQTPAPAPTQTIERVEITGSIFKRLSDQTALPVSTIRAEEISARGHVELKDFLLELPESSTIGFYSGTVGTLINLRGLGQARSLTLMNGRRFANEPLTDQYVSANTVPKIAMSRVETLRDGASSIYGSDAIGGVQNYYTFKTFTGVKLKADMMEPQRKGGGDTQGYAVLAGIGDLASQRWNVYGGFEYSKRNVLFRRDRPELSGLDANGLPNTNLSPDLIAMGLAGSTDLNSSTSTPANFLVSLAANGIPNGTVYNPYATTGCNSPISVRSSATATTCSLNVRSLNLSTYGNGTDLSNWYGKGTLALPGDHQLSLEVNHSMNHIFQYSNVVGITNQNYYLSLPKTSKWYPGGTGGVPITRNASGNVVVANASLASSPARLYLRWAPLDAGLPEIREEHVNDRVVLASEGTFLGFDYRAGLNWGRATRNTMRDNVYRTAALQSGLDDGTLNPFGLQDAAGMKYLQDNQIDKDIRRKAQTTNTSVDLTLTRELMDLRGGPLTFGLGLELRRNQWQAWGFATNDMTVVPGAIQAANTTAAYLGKVPTTYAEAIPNSNQPDSTMNGQATRKVHSIFTEVEAPVLRSVTLSAAVRADSYKYSHQTINGVNPKIGVRYQPTANIMLRASANTGFRVPSLPELFGNADGIRSGRIDDPLYCDSLTNTSKNPSLTTSQVCDVDIFEVTSTRSNGTKLKPEKSRAWTVGFGLQPSPDVAITLDYWSTTVRNMLGTVNLDTLVANYGFYEAQFIRRADGTIERVQNTKANAGDMRASGADFSFKLRLKTADVGTWTPSLDVSYTNDIATRLVGSTEWISALATSEPLGITTQDGLTGNRATMHRWKHTASLSWRGGKWSWTLAQRYQSKLRDRNEPARVNAAGSEGARDVRPYESFNLTVGYNGFKGLRLTAGINNLFAENPPLTNNSRYQGYQTQIADVLGRAYRMSAEYQF